MYPHNFTTLNLPGVTVHQIVVAVRLGIYNPNPYHMPNPNMETAWIKPQYSQFLGLPFPVNQCPFPVNFHINMQTDWL